MRYFTDTKRVFPAAAAIGALLATGLIAIPLVMNHHGNTPGAGGRRPGPVTDPSPVPTGVVILVHGARLADGIELGYPHTVVGAISAATEYLDAVASALNPDYAASLMRTAGDPAITTLPTDLAHSAVLLREKLQLPTTGPLPPSVSFRAVTEMYQLRDIETDSVLVLLLATDSYTDVYGNITQMLGVYPVRMHWTGGDWRLEHIGGTAQDYSVLAAMPGSLAAVDNGWLPLLSATGSGS